GAGPGGETDDAVPWATTCRAATSCAAWVQAASTVPAATTTTSHLLAMTASLFGTAGLGSHPSPHPPLTARTPDWFPRRRNEGGSVEEMAVVPAGGSTVSSRKPRRTA